MDSWSHHLLQPFPIDHRIIPIAMNTLQFGFWGCCVSGWKYCHPEGRSVLEEWVEGWVGNSHGENGGHHGNANNLLGIAGESDGEEEGEDEGYFASTNSTHTSHTTPTKFSKTKLSPRFSLSNFQAASGGLLDVNDRIENIQFPYRDPEGSKEWLYNKAGKSYRVMRTHLHESCGVG
jgi:hypothetical protein